MSCLVSFPAVFSVALFLTAGSHGRQFRRYEVLLTLSAYNSPFLFWVQQLSLQKGDQFFKGVEPPATWFVGNSLNHDAPTRVIARSYFLG